MHKINWNISLKLFISTALLTLLSVIILSTYSYKKYSTSLMEQSAEKVQQIIELTSLNIDTYLNDLYNLSLSPYYNQNVMDALDKNINDSDLNFLYRTRTIEDFLEQILIIPRKDIIRVFIITDEIYKGERVPSSIDDSKNFKNFFWYKKAFITKEPIFVSAHLEQIIKNPKNIVFSIVSVIKSTRNTDKILGVIKVDANYSGISNICNRADFGKNGGIFIMDENHQLIFSNIPNISQENIATLYDTITSNSYNYTTINIGNQNYLINGTLIKRAKWTIVGVTALSTINKKIIETRNSAFLIALICFIFSILIIILYLYRFLNPLKSIIKGIHKIQDGNLNVHFPTKTNDELSYLANSLNIMTAELKKMFEENTVLIKQIYETKYLQKEAQINSLFNQIRPHFIYNTLNMISMLIQCDRQKDAVDNINKLSSILRGMTHLDKDIPISTELELLDSYLTIQKNRYFGRLNYIIDINKELYDYTIPALIFQPIVENAVIHGCESKKEPTTITIKNIINDNNIIFIISDNGIGMTPTELNSVRQKISFEINNKDSQINLSEKGNGIALINVNKRIKIKYGMNYGLYIYSTKNKGTTVKIVLPKNPI